MSYTLLSESFPVARKRHRCIWCGEAIEPGTKYRRERSVYDGMQDHAWHLECDSDAKECFADGDVEFMPYSAERPTEPTKDAEARPHPASGGAAMSKIIHVALDVRGFLKNARFPRDYTRMFKHHDGRVMTPEEARDQLFDELARGHELIPVGACDDFDYSAGGGCRGHDRPDSEAMGLTRTADES